MTDKITRVALSSMYSAENVENLLMVINATPDPVIALEILLGIYEEPILPTTKASTLSTTGVLTLNSFDKMQDRVTYTYPQKNNKTRYFKTQEAADLIAVYSDNNESQYSYSDQYPIKKEFEMPDYKQSSSCTSKEWLSKPDVVVE